MASGLNQTQLRFMVGEVPLLKNLGSLSVDFCVCACVSLLCSKCLFSLSLGHVKSLLSACLLRKKNI